MKISENETVKSYGYGIRHIQVICMCLTMIALVIARSSLGVAVLAMTDMRRRNDTNVNVYEWDKNTQGLILSSFFWGYTLMQIPAGMLSKRYGGKPILLFALLANGSICALLPTLVQFGGWQIVCACRIIMGLTQACLLPANHTLLGKWLPAQERTSYSGIVYSGTPIGIIIAMPLSGMLAETKMGWTLIFYAMAVIMFLTSVIWIFFSASSPSDHRMMTHEEKEYIERGLNTSNSKALQIPWKKIFTTRGMWAVIFAHIGFCIGFILLLTDMPTYLEKGLHISLKNSAILSALPYLGMLIGQIISSIVCEKIYVKGYLSLLACRKLFNTIAFIGLAVGLAVLSSIGSDNKNLAIVILVTALTLSGFSAAGFLVTYLDISPNYAGVMLSITNLAANIGSIITPITTSLILQNDPTNLSRWRIVFLTAAGLSFVSNVGYVSLVSSERQDWDDPHYKDKQKADPEEMKPAIIADKT